MRRSTGFLILLMFLAGTAVVWAQDVVVTWRYIPTGGTGLDTVCTATAPMPDGWAIKIYWDSTANGVDSSDPQPAICAVPPNCTSGPAYTCNFNQFATNGVSRGYGGGYFTTTTNWKLKVGTPPNPLYYLRIYSPTDSVHALWTSAIKTVASGPQTISFVRSDWTCTPSTPQCIVKDAHE